MRQGEGTASIPFAEGDVTQLRREFKLVLSAGPAQSVRTRLLAEVGEPPPTTAIISVYFDRPGLPLTVRARATPEDCLKLRTKEYFPDRSGHRNHVVLEAKRERNGLTRKHRVWVPRASLAEALRSGDGLPPGTIDQGSLHPGARGDLRAAGLPGGVRLAGHGRHAVDIPRDHLGAGVGPSKFAA